MSIKHILNIYSNMENCKCSKCGKVWGLDRMYLEPVFRMVGESTLCIMDYHQLCKECVWETRDKEIIPDSTSFMKYRCPKCDEMIEVEKKCRIMSDDYETAECAKCGTSIKIELILGVLSNTYYRESKIKEIQND